jgi:uncharacterized protein (DUF58 family)
MTKATPEPATHRGTFRVSREGFVWLAVAVVLGFCGWYKNINMLLLMSYVMIALMIVNAVLAWRQVALVSAVRVPAAPAFAGETFTQAADVSNRHVRAVTVQVKSESAERTNWWFVPQLRAGETRRAVAELAVSRRGRTISPPLILQSGDPFGLIRYRRAVGPEDELIILPAVGRVDLTGLRRWLIRTGAGDAKTRRPVRRPGLHHADVRGVRPYRPGDGMKEIHWRTTARRNELVVREYDSTEPLDLILVLDAWQPVTASPADLKNVEWAISLTASICWAWAQADEAANLTLVIPGGTPEIQTIRVDRNRVRKALIPLASVRGSPTPPDISSGAVRIRSNRCARMVVSTRPNSPVCGQLRGGSGVPFVPVDASIAPVWYRPPTVGG